MYFQRTQYVVQFPPDSSFQVIFLVTFMTDSVGEVLIDRHIPRVTDGNTDPIVGVQ